MEESVSRSCHFTPGERAPGTHGIDSSVGPRAGLDAVAKRKFPALTANRMTFVQPYSVAFLKYANSHYYYYYGPPASYSLGIGSYFPGDKAAEA